MIITHIHCTVLEVHITLTTLNLLLVIKSSRFYKKEIRETSLKILHNDFDLDLGTPSQAIFSWKNYHFSCDPT